VAFGGVRRGRPAVDERGGIGAPGCERVQHQGQRGFGRPGECAVGSEVRADGAGHGGDAAAADEHADAGGAGDLDEWGDLVEEELVGVVQDGVDVSDCEADDVGRELVEALRQRGGRVVGEAQVEEVWFVSGAAKRGNEVFETDRGCCGPAVPVGVDE